MEKKKEDFSKKNEEKKKKENLENDYQKGLKKLKILKSEISKVIIGQEQVINKLLIGLITGGHILLEGLPGLAKTLLIKTISKCIGLKSKRVQFTPDLLPSDILGTLIYNQKTLDFELKKGPIFTDIIIADEINRAPSKVQSALLESMQEKQVTIGGENHKLSQYFWVLATENPIENEATYNLPEAQLDRFMLKIKIKYPTMKEERNIILKSLNEGNTEVKKVLNPIDINYLKEIIACIYIDENVINYILNIVNISRNPLIFNIKNNYIKFGASPRASINLALASKVVAFMSNRDFVILDDVKDIALDILRHRIIVNYEALVDEKTSEDIIYEILNNIET